MIKQKAIVGLLVGLIVISSGVLAGDLPEKDVVIQKDVEPEVQVSTAAEPVSVAGIEGLNEYEIEMMILDSLGRWSDMDVMSKVMSILGLIAWAGSWAGLYGLAVVGGPVGWLIFGIVMFYISNMTGPACLYRILN